MINPITLSIALLLLFIFLKIPVFISILAGTVAYFAMMPSYPSLLIIQRVTAGIESIPLLAVPFFVCAGVFMSRTGVIERITDLCIVLTGRLTGGLAQVNVLLSTINGGLSGSSLADAAMDSRMLVPIMRKAGFDNEFSSVVTAVSALITALIPPGLGMIIYASVTGISVAQLFMSGISVGIILCVSTMVIVGVISSKRKYQIIDAEKFTMKKLLKALKKSALPLMLPLIIIGGIRIGVFSATEAGAVAVIYTLILGILYKTVTFAEIIKGLKETVITTASIMLIIGASSSLSWILMREKIPQTLTLAMINFTTNKYLFFIIINIFLIFVGMFVEGSSIVIMLAPLVLPVSRAFGINDIQFAMVFLLNTQLGSITPPLGTVMYVTCGITGCKIKNFVIECIPFYLMLLALILLFIFVPQLTVGILNLMD
jgi:tripartite ATP-independent transporter DctM subunit